MAIVQAAPVAWFSQPGEIVKGQYSNCYDHYFQVYALEFFYEILSWPWFKAQAIAESSLDPTAKSSAGAFGVMQLMPGTSGDMARKLAIRDTPAVPHVNIRMGIAYDRQCWDIWKKESGIERVRFMLGSYNAGPGNILKAQKLAGAAKMPTDRWEFIAMCLPEITGKRSAETINYVAKIERLFTQLTAREGQKK